MGAVSIGGLVMLLVAALRADEARVREQRVGDRGFNDGRFAPAAGKHHWTPLGRRARIAAIKPTPSGDLELILDDGRTLAGSRRYRASLGAAASSASRSSARSRSNSC